MKNLLVYIHPEKIFVYGTDALIRVQIDNSLELGWKREDILLVMNFDYQYNGVKAMVIGDENYCVHSPTSSTINAIVTLFELEVIGDDLYWFHNIDAFQLEETIEPDLGVADMATTASIDVFPEGDKYFGAHRWDNAVIYFKKSSRDIFEQIKKNMNRYRMNEEVALVKVELSEKENPTFSDRIKILNTTYNFCAKTIDENFEKRYEIAEKPIKIIHFNPFDKRNMRRSKFLFNVCVMGQNTIGKALVTEKLGKLLGQYEIDMLEETPLCKIALRYRCDKCPKRGKHTYTPYYYSLLKARRYSIKKVLEIGVGKGASLKMWLDFFPNAHIYGADYRKDLLIKGDRMDSILCDQRRKEHLTSLINEIGPDIDLVIDDASHRPRDQIFTCVNLMPILSKKVIYVIEDVADPSIVERLKDYDVETPLLEQPRPRFDNRLVVVKNK